MPPKHFKLNASEIRPLAPGFGAYYASDRITVDGAPVGYMYREKPDQVSEFLNSGWRFFAGDETQEYADQAENFALYDVNTIANYSPDIIPLLASPVCTAFGRNEHGVLVQEPFQGSLD